MGAADDRVSELLDRWLASVELHARYLALDDAAYAQVQDWPRHQRPTRWIIDLARSRCIELKRQIAERGSRGDSSFADALELMAFLTSLLGSEHVERFIPLAVEGKAKPAATPATAPTVATPAATPLPTPALSPAPAPKAVPAPAQAAPAVAPSPTPGRAERAERTERTAPHRAATSKSRTGETRSGASRNTARASAQSRPRPGAQGASRPTRQVKGCGPRCDHDHSHRRCGPAAELGTPLAAACEPDRTPRRPACRARGVDDPAGAPCRNRGTGEAPAGVNPVAARLTGAEGFG